jgi:hypothetical protein
MVEMGALLDEEFLVRAHGGVRRPPLVARSLAPETFGHTHRSVPKPAGIVRKLRESDGTQRRLEGAANRMFIGSAALSSMVSWLACHAEGRRSESLHPLLKPS